MAPPVNRRTGYSRRAQFGTFIAYVGTVLGALIGVLVLLFPSAEHTILTSVGSTASDVAAAPARLVASIYAASEADYATLAGFAVSGSENAHLQRLVAQAATDRIKTAAIVSENQRLKDLLHLTQNTPHPVATAWLIASTDTSNRRLATISAGSSSGIQPGMPVVTPSGLVGRVLETGHISARILLLTDSETVIPVRRASDGVPAFASGRGDGMMQIRLLTLGINPLKPGDSFVASGAGGLFWPDTPVAVVNSLTHDGAIARTIANPYSSEVVAVQPIWNPVEDATLPAPSGPPRVANPLVHPAKIIKKKQPVPAHHHWL